MARDKTARERDENSLDRRSYLRLAGAAAASVATFGTGAAAEKSGDGVLLSEDFESGDYAQNYTSSYVQGQHDDTTTEVVKDGSSSLKVEFPEGSHYGLDSTYDPVEAGDADEEAKELYHSYWVRFSPNFDTIHSNGKLPGIVNIEPEGPHAGTKSDGTNGWRVCGRYQDATADTIDIGYYAYHMDQPRRYGHRMVPATIPKGEWVHVEQYVKLNTVSNGNANPDGELKLWVNGDLQLDRKDMRYTLEPERGINTWWVVYHGGNNPAPHDQSIYFDGWKVSTERIGLSQEPSGPTIDKFDVTKSEQLGDERMFSVQWDVSDTDELESVEVAAVQDAANINFDVTDANGKSSSGWKLFQFPVETEIEVKLRAKNAAGNVTEETKTITL